jgi:succinylglutamate desuccinylase
MNNNYAQRLYENDRVIGVYEGNRKGPLFLVIGGIHGNEPAGVHAMEQLFEMLYNEPIYNPAFLFFGNLVAIKGNLQALNAKKRYIKEDLNRILTKERIKHPETLQFEDIEIRNLINCIRFFIQKYQPEKLIILDLHTTTAHGGIFSITSLEQESERIAVELHAPVVRGIHSGIGGTTLHYFNSENLGVNTTTIVFESGQHDDPSSVDNATSAVINCLRSSGCVLSIDVEDKHDDLLTESAQYLPPLVSIRYTHHIKDGDNFVMHPGYQNFQPVRKDELLAHDKNGEIRSPMDALILMPLYQKQGTDGFFLVQEVYGF